MSVFELVTLVLFAGAGVSFIWLLVRGAIAAQGVVIFLALFAINAGVYWAARAFWGDLPSLILSVVVSVVIWLLLAVVWSDEREARRLEKVAASRRAGIYR